MKKELITDHFAEFNKMIELAKGAQTAFGIKR
jgi:hypothetical protein